MRIGLEKLRATLTAEAPSLKVSQVEGIECFDCGAEIEVTPFVDDAGAGIYISCFGCERHRVIRLNKRGGPRQPNKRATG